MTSVTVGELVLVRFPPMHASGLQEDAQDSFDALVKKGEIGEYSVSTWGREARGGETLEQLVSDVCAKADLRGRKVGLVTGTALSGVGLVARASGDPGHHDVVLGAELKLDLVEWLANTCLGNRMKNPWDK